MGGCIGGWSHVTLFYCAGPRRAVAVLLTCNQCRYMMDAYHQINKLSVDHKVRLCCAETCGCCDVAVLPRLLTFFQCRYMTDAYHQIHKLSVDHKVPLRVAAFILAVKRVAQAEQHRGFD